MEQGKVHLQNQPFPVYGAGHAVDYAGVDKKNIAFLQCENFFHGGYIVRVFHGHNNFNGRVPVFGVGFIIGVVVQQKTGHFFVDDGFLDTV